jgi:hypothetical protein
LKHVHLIASLALLSVTACGPLPLPRLGGAPTQRPTAAASAPNSVQPTVEPTPLAGPAPTVDTCPPGQAPTFVFGFAGLKERLGARMGDPLSCERPGPEGDALQQTTTGMARYRKTTNTPSFTSGDEHWALTDRGLVHWLGQSLDPPASAEVVGDEMALASPTRPPMAFATPPSSTELISTTADNGANLLPDQPAWLQQAAAYLNEYDRRNATVLVPVIQRAGISLRPLRELGAWGLFVPSSHRIVLDPSLADEAPQAVAPVLGHEADHARDAFQYGAPRSQAACYSWEITAFVLEARIWASFYGPSGKPDPQTDLEQELNLILSTSRANPGNFMNSIKENYQAECE